MPLQIRKPKHAIQVTKHDSALCVESCAHRRSFARALSVASCAHRRIFVLAAAAL